MSTDEMSEAPSNLSLMQNELKIIKKEMKYITDDRKLKQYILEKSDLLAAVNTELLNSYHSVESHKIYRRRGMLGVVKSEDTRFGTISKMRADIDQLKSILYNIVQLNGLKLPD
jgi:hypothetical protein